MLVEFVFLLGLGLLVVALVVLVEVLPQDLEKVFSHAGARTASTNSFS